MKPIQILHRAWHVDVIGVAAVVGVSTLAYAAGLRPVVDQRAAELRATASRTSNLARLDELNNQTATAIARLEKIRFDTAQSEVDIRPLAERNQRQKTITDLANECGLTVEEVDPGAPVLADAARRLVEAPVRIGGRGEYPRVNDFLARLHKQFPDVSVSGMRLASPRLSGGASRFSLQLLWLAMDPPQPAKAERPGG